MTGFSLSAPLLEALAGFGVFYTPTKPVSALVEKAAYSCAHGGLNRLAFVSVPAEPMWTKISGRRRIVCLLARADRT